MFIGRTQEMAILQRLTAAQGFQFLVVYGRRRVGKTTLLSEFCQGRNAVFFVADEFDEKASLDRFSRQLLAWVSMPDLAQPFASWDAAFEFLARRAEQERVVLVIDEYPYLAEAYPRISSLLQNLIDHRFAAGQLFLILCGSSVGFMEREVLGEKSPLFGRRTAQLQLQPLSFAERRKVGSFFLNGRQRINLAPMAFWAEFRSIFGNLTPGAALRRMSRKGSWIKWRSCMRNPETCCGKNFGSRLCITPF